MVAPAAMLCQRQHQAEALWGTPTFSPLLLMKGLLQLSMDILFSLAWMPPGSLPFSFSLQLLLSLGHWSVPGIYLANMQPPTPGEGFSKAPLSYVVSFSCSQVVNIFFFRTLRRDLYS